jgi:hypothetical protein
MKSSFKMQDEELSSPVRVPLVDLDIDQVFLRAEILLVAL